MTVRIVIDAMGGDHAPDEIVRAAAETSNETTIETVLVGDETQIRRLLDGLPHEPARIHVQHAPDAIRMDESPKEAVLAKPRSSIVVGTQLLASKGADGLVSAGNTGAIILAGARNLPRLTGVKKTALASVYPTRKRFNNNDIFALMLDVGANVNVSPEDLVHFAYMGSAYASKISKVDNPSVGLLNVGEEAHKGTDVLREAHGLLAGATGLNFSGNIEGKDIPNGPVDVVVCDGVMGNIVLKMLEGMSEAIIGLGREAFKANLLWKIGLLMLSSGIRQVKNLTDYSEYGGAPILGFDKICIKAHGRSKAKAIKNAIKVAAKAVRDDVCGGIAAGIEEFNRRRSA